MPKVSVVIPVYNGEQFIEEALESVFAQTFEDFEVVVINDGSTDQTEARLAKYRHQIDYIKQENIGLAATRGRAVELARGSLIASLDADDVWLPRKLERQVQAAQEHPECGIITTDVLSFLNGQVVTPSLKEWYGPASGNALENLLFANWIPPSAAMVRRECFDQVKTFSVPPPAYGEDWLMWMQIAAKYPVHFVDEVLVRRRVHPASMSSRGGETQFRCLLRNLEIVRKRMPQLNGRPSLIDEAAFRLCLARGLQDLQALRMTEARGKLRRAVGYKPYAPGAWALLAGTFLPRFLISGFAGSLRRLRRAHA